MILFVLIFQTLFLATANVTGVFAKTSKADRLQSEIENRTNSVNTVNWEGLGDPVTGFIANTASFAANGLTFIAGEIQSISSLLFAEFTVVPDANIPTMFKRIIQGIMMLKWVGLISFLRGALL